MKRVFLIIFSLVFLPSYVQAVDFSFTDLGGETYAGLQLQGTPLVINVGSHW